DAGVACPARSDRRAVALDRVVEAEARAAQLAAVGADRQPVVEACGGEVADVGLDRQRLDPLCPQARVAAAEACQVVDAGDLEPDEVNGVVRDPLRVGLGEAHAYLGLEVEVHGLAVSTIERPRRRLRCRYQAGRALLGLPSEMNGRHVLSERDGSSGLAELIRARQP